MTDWLTEGALTGGWGAVCELGVMLVRNSERSKLLFERLDGMAGDSWVGPPACLSWSMQAALQSMPSRSMLASA